MDQGLQRFFTPLIIFASFVVARVAVDPRIVPAFIRFDIDFSHSSLIEMDPNHYMRADHVLSVGNECDGVRNGIAVRMIIGKNGHVGAAIDVFA